MLIAYGRDNPVRTYPAVTTVLVVANTILFFGLLHSDFDANFDISVSYGLIPALPTTTTFLSYMFLHGDFMHLFGNMLFLWVFGPNVEDLMGRVMYPIFYILCGLMAALLHMMSVHGTPHGTIPLIGASGAISGLMGAYFVLFPLSKIRAFPLFIPINAFWMILIWLYFQFRSQMVAGATAGVAFMAHIGGFAFGAGILYLLIRIGVIVVPHFEAVKQGRYAAVKIEEDLLEKMHLARQTGRFGPVAAAYAELLNKAPKTTLEPAVLNELGEGLARAGRPDLALAAYRRLMTDHAATPHALRAGIEAARIAFACYDNPDSAMQHLRWVVARTPNSPLAAEAQKEMRRISLAMRGRQA